MRGSLPVVLPEERAAFTGEFEDLEIKAAVNPLGDVYLTYQFKVKSTTERLLVPIAGYKPALVPLPLIEGASIPLLTRVEEVEVEIVKVHVEPQPAASAQIYQMADGNKGVVLELPKGIKCTVSLVCRISKFTRAEFLGTDLVISIFPPWGWKKEKEVSIEFSGSLITSIWGHKLLAAVHHSLSGKRMNKKWKIFGGKIRPGWPFIGTFWRALKPGNFQRWEFSVSSLGDDEEVRLRARAGRFPLLPGALVSPILPAWFLILILIVLWRFLS